MKIGKGNTFICQSVNVRCMYNGISVAGKLSVTLVIGHYNNDIGKPGGLFRTCRAAGHGKACQGKQQKPGNNVTYTSPHLFQGVGGFIF
jgi:hypothetical protein